MALSDFPISSTTGLHTFPKGPTGWNEAMDANNENIYSQMMNMANKSELASTDINKGASQIGIADIQNYYTGTTVEAALAELAPVRVANFHNTEIDYIVGSWCNVIYRIATVQLTINMVNVLRDGAKIPEGFLWGTLPAIVRPQFVQYYRIYLTDNKDTIPIILRLSSSGSITSMNEAVYNNLTGGYETVCINYSIERI